jgi:flavin-dependent dehydrogenase
VIGEAARMVHPATAEGIYQGMRSGMLAAEALAAVVAGRRDERHAFAAYERRCRRAFRLSFGASRVWRGLIRTPVLDWVVAATERPAVKRSLALLMARM